jgi:hypothetical protein
MVWGGAGPMANNYRLDGLAMNHPGFGGDLLSASIDWVEAVEVSGLGAGASYGDFQGGVINAITRSGTDQRRTTLRATIDGRGWAVLNPNLREEGHEQAMRREVSGETSGPIVKGRLFYFTGGQHVRRDLRVPDLMSLAPRDFRDERIEETVARGIGKLTFLPTPTSRIEALGILSRRETERLGMTGFDEARAAQNLRAPAAAFEVSWNTVTSRRGAFDVRVGGLSSSEHRDALGSTNLPGIRLYQLGREPMYQNASFTESTHPSQYSAHGRWTTALRTGSIEHRVDVGTEASLGYWRQQRTRNGGVTWRPFARGSTSATDPSTWSAFASEWGGNIFLDSRMTSQAVYLEDRVRLGSRVTLAPGVRLGRWKGYLDPAGAPSYQAVTATGWDPRIGVVYDPTGENRFVIKAHWGIYHQGMSAALFDRVGTASPYQDERFYAENPPTWIPSAQEPWTDARRDQEFLRSNGSPIPWQNLIRSEAGPAENYRQPYVRQFVAGVERAWKGRWNARAVFIDRTNHDFVGLVDRNLASNYTAVHGLTLGTNPTGLVGDFEGFPLTFDDIYVRNDAVKRVLQAFQAGGAPAPAGLSYAMIPNLTYDPDIVFTTIPEARRRFQQTQLSLSAMYPDWSGLMSITMTRLRGNTAGVTTLGGVGSAATAGQWVRPNEGIGSYGYLPGYSPVEAKIWLSGKLTQTIEAGITTTFVAGEYFRPSYEIELGRYTLLESLFPRISAPDELFDGVLGQTVYMEPNRSRHYGDRMSVDLRAQRPFRWRGSRIMITADILNALDDRTPILVHTLVNQTVEAETRLRLTNPRLRMQPRLFRIGSRIEFGDR